MVSENFIDLIENCDEGGTTANVLSFNNLINQLESIEDKEAGSYFFTTRYAITQHIRDISKDSFKWDRNVGTKLKEFFQKFQMWKSPIFIQLASNKLFENLFNISHFQIFFTVDLGRVGGSPSYDESLRALSCMLVFFVNFYFKKYLSYKPLMKTKTLHLYDPCFREKLREQNQNDPEIKEKIMSDCFDIKKFALICLKAYFPEVSWRWLGGKQFAHYVTLKIINLIFELGLWKREELEDLLIEICSISEILINLESNIKKDSFNGRFGTSTISDWKILSAKCRKKIGSIFLHLIVIHLDEEIMSVVPQFKIALPSFFSNCPSYIPKRRTHIESLFHVKKFTNTKLYTYFAYYLVGYLLRPMHYYTEEYTVDSPSLQHIINLLIGYASEVENNFFSVSLNTFQSESFAFYMIGDNSPIYDLPKQYEEKLKAVIKNIQTGGYGVLNNENINFLQEVAELFEQIIAFFNSLPKKAEVIFGFQLAFILKSIPQYLLSIINLIIDTYSKSKNISETIKLGVRAVIAICHKNNQGINNLFSHFNFSHVFCLLENDLLNGLFLVVEFLGKASALYILEKNPELFKKLIENYVQSASALDQQIAEVSSLEQVVIDPSIIVGNIVYSKLLQQILKRSDKRTFKFEISISGSLYQTAMNLIKTLSNKNFRPDSSFEGKSTNYNKAENFFKIASEWETLGGQAKVRVVYESIYSTLALFEQSIKRVYAQNIFDGLSTAFKPYDFERFFWLFDSSYSLRICKKVLNIFSNVMIFPQNHILDKQSLQIFKNGTEIEGHTMKEQIDFAIYEQLAAIMEVSKTALLQKVVSLPIVNAYLSSYFPALFKQCSGALTYLTKRKFKVLTRNEKSKLIVFMQTFLDFIVEAKQNIEKSLGPKNVDQHTSKFILNFQTLYREMNEMYFYRPTSNREVDMFRQISYQLMNAIVELYLYNQKKIHYISEFVRYNYYDFQESTRSVMKSKLNFMLKFRNEGYSSNQDKQSVIWSSSKRNFETLSTTVKEAKDETLDSFPLVEKSFDCKMPEEANNTFTKTRNIEPLENNENTVLNTTDDGVGATSVRNTEIEHVIVYLKERYKFMKTYFLVNSNSNQFFIVFQLQDIIKNNVEILIDYFFRQIKIMDISCNDLDSNFFTNEFYFSLFIFMDNLISASRIYRKTFYDKFVKEGDREVIKKIWDLHRLLVNYSLYSIFLDSRWKQIFSAYYLISNFIQNLCEDNFDSFKEWFAKETDFEGNNISLVEDYYSFLENAIANTELFQHEKEQLTLADKPELLFVYNRLMEGVTEFINGGKTLGQQLIYQKTIDIWVGIVMRVVDDVDSSFYHLKYNVLLYLCATAEGLDKSVIEFLGNNFSVNQMFLLLVRLLKKLYVRQYIIIRNKKSSWNKKRQESTLNIVKIEDEKSVCITSYESIMDYYKRYESTFSDHVIMDTFVTLYTFTKNMSKSVLRYKNFIEEIDGLDEIDFKQSGAFKNETYDPESIRIWHFIRSIIVEIEILYKALDLGDDQESKLRVYHFKKLPICHFLTDNIKDNFRFYADINSIDVKHDQFFAKSKSHIIIIRDLRLLYKKSKILFYALTEEAFQVYIVILYLFACAINILLLILQASTNEPVSQSNSLNIGSVITILAIVDASLAFICFLFWITFKYPTNKKIKWEEYHMINKMGKMRLLQKLKINLWESFFKKKLFRVLSAHISLNILGICVSSFFYTLLLLTIVDLSFLVYSVVISFVNNYDKLAYTLLMIMVILNFFAYLASDSFETDFEHNEDTKVLCTTYFTCFINNINVGLRSGGGIADKMSLNSNNHSPNFEGRFFFDVMFFILINIILLGMFFGIIVDSFKEYRDMIEQKRSDRENICFTCGLERNKLEKTGIDFQEHIKYHEIWNYLFYMIYLEGKPLNSYNGIDLYVKEKIEMNSRREWIPVGWTLGYEVEATENS